MDQFQLGDRIIYNPNMPLGPAHERPHHHGVVLGKEYENNYLLIQFTQHPFDEPHRILYTAISHLDIATHIAPLIDPEGIAAHIAALIAPHIAPLIDLPIGTSDIITYEEFNDGDIIADFPRMDGRYESHFNSYYRKDTFHKLKKNPFTDKQIESGLVKLYKVRLV